MKHIIRATYYYYSGTFNAPKNGMLHDPQTGERMEFDTREEAEVFLTGQAMELENNGDGTFSAPGTYVTSHGEYARPDYAIRKLPARKPAAA